MSERQLGYREGYEDAELHYQHRAEQAEADLASLKVVYQDHLDQLKAERDELRVVRDAALHLIIGAPEDQHYPELQAALEDVTVAPPEEHQEPPATEKQPRLRPDWPR